MGRPLGHGENPGSRGGRWAMGRPLGLRVTPFPSARTEQSCLRHPSAPADGSASAAPRKPAEAYGSSLAPLIWETRGTGRLASRSFFQTPRHACSALLRLLALRRPLLRASTALSLPLALPLALPTPMVISGSHSERGPTCSLGSHRSHVPAVGSRAPLSLIRARGSPTPQQHGCLLNDPTKALGFT